MNGRLPDLPTRQLSLPLGSEPDYTAPFIPAGSNAEALAWLERTKDWPGARLALWGVEGCGKTHLLHVWAARTGARFVGGETLPESPTCGALAVDDAEALLHDETGFLHFLNRSVEARQPVLLASRQPPARWLSRLPDLQSRLNATTAVEVRAAGDELLASLLARLLADRQLSVPKSLRSWLLTQLPRTPAVLREAVSRLDALSLAAGGTINRKLVREVVAAIVTGANQ